MSHLNRLTLVGSGVLGGQIAFHSAFKGKTVVVYDIAEDAIARCQAAHDEYAAIYQSDLGATDADIAATKQRLTFTTDLAAAVAQADLVIEAVPEIPDVKTSVYKEMAELLPAHTLIATNTSLLLPSDFAAATGRPEKFCALHFANLIWAMNFAEIMAHPGSSTATLTEVTEFAVEIGMMPIPVRREHSGYVVNSWFFPFMNAAQTLVTNGISTPEDIDRTFMVLGAPMGPLGLADMVGMNTAYNVTSYTGHQTGDAQMIANAEYLKKNFLDKGLLGRQTGKGYYEYPNPAFQRPDFLEVPDISVVPHVVSLISHQ
ncbi:MAG TPA: 3-hydroxyacyl-CoA dehydrogenase [Mycobacterium sp.]